MITSDLSMQIKMEPESKELLERFLDVIIEFNKLMSKHDYEIDVIDVIKKTPKGER